MYYKPCHPANYSDQKRTKTQIKYIVVHYTANDGDTAAGNLAYFARETVKASAHYFVDEKEVAVRELLPGNNSSIPLETHPNTLQNPSHNPFDTHKPS